MKSPKSKSNEVYRRRIDRVIDHVNANLDKTFSLDELASVAAFSPYHFHRIFMAITGESVNFFTNRVRLEKSARLLKFSKSSIADVALECGFSSPSTLSRAFKQYFGITPTLYRQSPQIENSKIRKELVPLAEYLCPMSDEEMVAEFPVEIRQFPQRRVAYIRVVDSYREGVVTGAFEKLVNWAKEAGVYESGTFFGMSLDDPKVTPKEKYRYEACVTLPEKFKVGAGAPVETMTMPALKYAVVNAKGEFNYVATAIYYLFNNWLLNSSYEPAHAHGMEVFLDKARISNWEHFHLDLCLPVQSLNTY